MTKSEEERRRVPPETGAEEDSLPHAFGTCKVFEHNVWINLVAMDPTASYNGLMGLEASRKKRLQVPSI